LLFYWGSKNQKIKYSGNRELSRREGKNKKKSGMVAHAYNPATAGGREAGGSQV
jgi:hypothetical protein